MNQNIHLIQQSINSQLIHTMVDNHFVIENWFKEYWANKQPIFYSSVDIRINNYKLAPVDTNLFPGGFNNIQIEDYALCIQAIHSILYEIDPEIKNIAIVSEMHTRNLFYLENLCSLCNIFKMAGYNVIIVNPKIEEEKLEIELENNRKITIHKLHKKNNTAYTQEQTPCILILNNDLMEEKMQEIEDIKQKVLPDPFYGWYQRTKDKHFSAYDKVCKIFAEKINIDSWLIAPMHKSVDNIDINDPNDLEILAEKTQLLLDKIQEKYNQYNIDQEPFVVLKANSGTYGMGVLTIKNAEQIKQLNRKGRKELTHTKSRVKISSILIQEGVFTNFKLYDNCSAEPTLYMISRYVIGGFYRFHSEKKDNESLNTTGMKFDSIAIEKPCCIINSDDVQDPINAFYVLGVVARLANIAALEEKLV